MINENKQTLDEDVLTMKEQNMPAKINSEMLCTALDELLFSWKFCLIVVPVVFLCSIFFVPDTYSGLTPSTQTMQASASNKYLFDFSFFLADILLLVVLFRYLIQGFSRQLISKLPKLPDNVNSKRNMTIIYTFIFFLAHATLFISSNGLNRGSRYDYFNDPVLFNFVWYFPMVYGSLFLFFIFVLLNRHQE